MPLARHDCNHTAGLAPGLPTPHAASFATHPPCVAVDYLAALLPSFACIHSLAVSAPLQQILVVGVMQVTHELSQPN
jgi:hypothetical protein